LTQLLIFSSHTITRDVSIVETAKSAEFFHSDGVILTGVSTGSPGIYKEMLALHEAVSVPVIIGSGVDINNVEQYLSANAMIIGSHFNDGHWSKPICFDKVKSFMAKVERMRK
jgi:hypothetical protein